MEGVDLNAAMVAAPPPPSPSPPFHGVLTSALLFSSQSAVEQECAARFSGGYAVESRKGLVPYNRNKVNQDRALFKLGVQSDPQLSLFGVMDGHGEFGHFVAGFVQEKLPQNLALQTELKTKTRDAILAATDVTCKQLAKSGINCTFSGTTCVYAVQVADRLFVANIGDSRCVLCRVPPNPPAAGALPFECIALSNDQKPDVKAEKERILAAGGRVEPLPGTFLPSSSPAPCSCPPRLLPYRCISLASSSQHQPLHAMSKQRGVGCRLAVASVLRGVVRCGVVWRCVCVWPDLIAGPPGEDCGPPRVWLPEVDVPGLAMSRSIGDEVRQPPACLCAWLVRGCDELLSRGWA